MLTKNLEDLDQNYGEKRPFAMLTCLILSAATMDILCIDCTVKLFKADLLNPQAMVNADHNEIVQLIQSCGIQDEPTTYHMKMAQMLIDNHNGKVPYPIARRWKKNHNVDSK
jgi:endonuclease III